MKKDKTFFDRLNNKYNTLSKKQLITADYIKNNYKTAALMSIIPLSETIGVSEATVVRFANVLGYKGFIDMMKDIKDYIKKELSTVERFEKYHEESDELSPVYRVINNNINVLNRLSLDISKEFIDVIADEILKANKVIIIGFESTASFADYFEYHLSRCGKKVETITERSGELFNIIEFINKDDFCISMSFPRHSDKQVSILEYLRKKGLNVYSITDDLSSPVIEFSQYATYIPMNNTLMGISSIHVGILSIIQMVMFQYILKDDINIKNRFNNLEGYHEFFKTFYEK